MLRAQSSECLTEAEVVGCKLGGPYPLRRQVGLVGGDANNGRIRHAEPLQVNSGDTNAARRRGVSITEPAKGRGLGSRSKDSSGITSSHILRPALHKTFENAAYHKFG